MIILIPSFNELVSLKKIIKYLKRKKYNFFIIDDCSKDGTNIFLKKNNIKFIRNQNNLGYTISIIKGFKYLSKTNHKYLLTMDADGEHKLSNIEMFEKLIKKKKVDLISGNRNKKNRFIEKILGYIFKIKYNINDPLCGFKIYNLKKISKIIKNIKNDNYLIDIIKIYHDRNFLYEECNIQVNKIKNRKSRIGNIFVSNFKLIKLLYYIFK